MAILALQEKHLQRIVFVWPNLFRNKKCLISYQLRKEVIYLLVWVPNTLPLKLTCGKLDRIQI